MENTKKRIGYALFRDFDPWKSAAEILDKSGRFQNFPNAVEKRLWKVKNFVEYNRIMVTCATRRFCHWLVTFLMISSTVAFWRESRFISFSILPTE